MYEALDLISSTRKEGDKGRRWWGGEWKESNEGWREGGSKGGKKEKKRKERERRRRRSEHFWPGKS